MSIDVLIMQIDEVWIAFWIDWFINPISVFDLLVYFVFYFVLNY